MNLPDDLLDTNHNSTTVQQEFNSYGKLKFVESRLRVIIMAHFNVK